MSRSRIDQFTVGKHVRAFYAAIRDKGETRAEGMVIGYYSQPTVIIETPDGEHVAWAADLCEVTDDD